jgi:thiol-disulfide isomerase/thioredoxin
MSKEVWIIGVDPPCPRCDLARQRVERLAKELGTSINVQNLIYSDPEVREFAASIGKETGTAKDVVQKAGVEIDWNHVSAVYKNPPSQPEDIDIIDGPAKHWSPEFDEALRPCQGKAESVGLLMTPIVVVQGEVKHQGSVPSIKQLRTWLT